MLSKRDGEMESTSSSTFKKKRLEDEAYVVDVVLVFAAAIQ